MQELLRLAFTQIRALIIQCVYDNTVRNSGPVLAKCCKAIFSQYRAQLLVLHNLLRADLVWRWRRLELAGLRSLERLLLQTPLRLGQDVEDFVLSGGSQV